MPAATLLAQSAAATAWHDTPADVRDQAADLILDTFAVIAAGGKDSAYAAYTEASACGDGPCTVVGRARKTNAAAAALVNGGATTVLQLQDGHRIARGHPASHVTPAAFAVAEETNAAAEVFLGAFVAGYETAVRIGASLGGLKPDLHDAGTWSTMGAATAAAYIMKRDPKVIEAAIDGAAAFSLMGWLQTAPQGAGIHHLFIGSAASSGITAAHAAVAGLNAIPGTVEHFFGPRAGAKFNADRLADGMQEGHWSRYELMHAYMKIHPTCAHLHGLNDAVEHLIAEHKVKGEDVASVDIATYHHALVYDNPEPQTELAARFSAALTTAIALQRGNLDQEAVTMEALQDPAVKSLAARTTVRHDPDLDRYYPAGRPSRITLTMNDGRTLSELRIYPRGDHTNPTTRPQRREKATRLFASRFGATQADRIVAAFDRLIEGGPLESLSSALRGA
jgi:2-methylcitrate dehydratase PrpD